jgi:COP9 signalosome complex subunit 12
MSSFYQILIGNLLQNDTLPLFVSLRLGTTCILVSPVSRYSPSESGTSIVPRQSLECHKNTSIMDVLFRDFEQAHLQGSGPLLSTTLLPISPPEDPNRLRRLVSSSSLASLASDLRHGLLSHKNTGIRLSKIEGNAWLDVYVAYWKAANEIVSLSEGGPSDHTSVYEAWKELTNVLLRGYSGASPFGAWTVPCLYVVGRYLRIFAIKADDHGRENKSVTYDPSMQEDITGAMGKNEKLEDAARVINRAFTLCSNDRYERI